MNRLLRRLAQALVTLGVVTGLGVVTTGTASAHGIGEYACNYVVGVRNACLLVTDVAPGYFHLRIGIDITMSQQQAQAYLDDPAPDFTAILYGYDGRNVRQYLASPPLVSVTAWSGGLSAEWEMYAPSIALNEDNGADELIVEIWFFEAPGSTQTIETGQVVAWF
jgi:hypothetical protein